MSSASDCLFEGISFDAEGTLILYKDGMSDSELYVDALMQFNAIESQAGRSTIRIPTWVDRQTQKAAYSQAWELGMHQVALELKLSQEQQRQWEAGVYGPLMDLHTAVRLYRLVTFYYFCSGGVICTGTSLAGVPPVPSHMQTQTETSTPTPVTSEGNFEAFTHYLIFHYYIDPANLRMPRSFLSQPEEEGNATSSDSTRVDYCNTPLWRVLKEEFPQLQLCVVSNTDSRIRDALYQFPLYKQLFQGRIFTACDVPETKPSGAGILMARKQLLAARNDGEKHRSQGGPEEAPVVVPAQGRQARKLWLHVGDELEADGQAALSSGSLFLCCGKKVGVDLEALKAVLRSRDPESLLKQLNEPFGVNASDAFSLSVFQPSKETKVRSERMQRPGSAGRVYSGLQRPAHAEDQPPLHKFESSVKIQRQWTSWLAGQTSTAQQREGHVEDITGSSTGSAGLGVERRTDIRPTSASLHRSAPTAAAASRRLKRPVSAAPFRSNSTTSAHTLSPTFVASTPDSAVHHHSIGRSTQDSLRFSPPRRPSAVQEEASLSDEVSVLLRGVQEYLAILHTEGQSVKAQSSSDYANAAGTGTILGVCLASLEALSLLTGTLTPSSRRGSSPPQRPPLETEGDGDADQLNRTDSHRLRNMFGSLRAYFIQLFDILQPSLFVTPTPILSDLDASCGEVVQGIREGHTNASNVAWMEWIRDRAKTFGKSTTIKAASTTAVPALLRTQMTRFEESMKKRHRQQSSGAGAERDDKDQMSFMERRSVLRANFRAWRAVSRHVSASRNVLERVATERERFVLREALLQWRYAVASAVRSRRSEDVFNAAKALKAEAASKETLMLQYSTAGKLMDETAMRMNDLQSEISFLKNKLEEYQSPMVFDFRRPVFDAKSGTILKEGVLRFKHHRREDFSKVVVELGPQDEPYMDLITENPKEGLCQPRREPLQSYYSIRVESIPKENKEVSLEWLLNAAHSYCRSRKTMVLQWLQERDASSSGSFSPRGGLKAPASAFLRAPHLTQAQRQVFDSPNWEGSLLREYAAFLSGRHHYIAELDQLVKSSLLQGGAAQFLHRMLTKEKERAKGDASGGPSDTAEMDGGAPALLGELDSLGHNRCLVMYSEPKPKFCVKAFSEVSHYPYLYIASLFTSVPSALDSQSRTGAVNLELAHRLLVQIGCAQQLALKDFAASTETVHRLAVSRVMSYCVLAQAIDKDQIYRSQLGAASSSASTATAAGAEDKGSPTSPAGGQDAESSSATAAAAGVNSPVLPPAVGPSGVLRVKTTKSLLCLVQQRDGPDYTTDRSAIEVLAWVRELLIAANAAASTGADRRDRKRSLILRRTAKPPTGASPLNLNATYSEGAPAGALRSPRIQESSGGSRSPASSPLIPSSFAGPPTLNVQNLEEDFGEGLDILVSILHQITNPSHTAFNSSDSLEATAEYLVRSAIEDLGAQVSTTVADNLHTCTPSVKLMYLTSLYNAVHKYELPSSLAPQHGDGSTNALGTSSMEAGPGRQASLRFFAPSNVVTKTQTPPQIVSAMQAVGNFLCPIGPLPYSAAKALRLIPLFGKSQPAETAIMVVQRVWPILFPLFLREAAWGVNRVNIDGTPSFGLNLEGAARLISRFGFFTVEDPAAKARLEHEALSPKTPSGGGGSSSPSTPSLARVGSRKLLSAMKLDASTNGQAGSPRALSPSASAGKFSELSRTVSMNTVAARAARRLALFKPQFVRVFLQSTAMSDDELREDSRDLRTPWKSVPNQLLSKFTRSDEPIVTCTGFMEFLLRCFCCLETVGLQGLNAAVTTSSTNPPTTSPPIVHPNDDQLAQTEGSELATAPTATAQQTYQPAAFGGNSQSAWLLQNVDKVQTCVREISVRLGNAATAWSTIDPNTGPKTSSSKGATVAAAGAANALTTPGFNLNYPFRFADPRLVRKQLFTADVLRLLKLKSHVLVQAFSAFSYFTTHTWKLLDQREMTFKQFTELLKKSRLRDVEDEEEDSAQDAASPRTKKEGNAPVENLYKGIGCGSQSAVSLSDGFLFRMFVTVALCRQVKATLCEPTIQLGSKIPDQASFSASQGNASVAELELKSALHVTSPEVYTLGYSGFCEVLVAYAISVHPSPWLSVADRLGFVVERLELFSSAALR